MVTFPYPKGNIWQYPGFPSLIIPYGESNDFFWSGHCGFLMIVTLEWYENRRRVMVFITVLINIYIGFVMVVFRIHYTVDIIIGVAMGHYFYINMGFVYKQID